MTLQVRENSVGRFDLFFHSYRVQFHILYPTPASISFPFFLRFFTPEQKLYVLCFSYSRVGIYHRTKLILYSSITTIYYYYNMTRCGSTVGGDCQSNLFFSSCADGGHIIYYYNSNNSKNTF